MENITYSPEMEALLEGDLGDNIRKTWDFSKPFGSFYELGFPVHFHIREDFTVYISDEELERIDKEHGVHVSVSGNGNEPPKLTFIT